MVGRPYGRVHVAEPLSSIFREHRHDGSTLRPVTHTITAPVLDQSNLIEQGLSTSMLFPGCAEVDALGSCVGNATTEALSAILPEPKLLALGLAGSAAQVEACAIRLYHDFTMLSGDTSSEYPPDDCGSSGLAACKYLEQRRVISEHKIASDAETIVSLMQQGPLIVGQPWFYDWEEPAANGMIDGNGTVADLDAAAASGVAGGHETCWFSVESLAFTRTGRVDPAKTVIGFRQSWGPSWGDHGTGYAHLSTYIALRSYCDFRLLIP